MVMNHVAHRCQKTFTFTRLNMYCKALKPLYFSVYSEYALNQVNMWVEVGQLDPTRFKVDLGGVDIYT